MLERVVSTASFLNDFSRLVFDAAVCLALFVGRKRLTISVELKIDFVFLFFFSTGFSPLCKTSLSLFIRLSLCLSFIPPFQPYSVLCFTAPNYLYLIELPLSLPTAPYPVSHFIGFLLFHAHALQAPRKFCDSRDAGMYICTWGGPQNPPAPHSLLYTSEAAWSGVMYPFVGLALITGQSSIALQCLEDLRNQYDGTRRSPYNEIECGDHYTRPMGGFSLFELASGQVWTG